MKLFTFGEKITRTMALYYGVLNTSIYFRTRVSRVCLDKRIKLENKISNLWIKNNPM